MFNHDIAKRVLLEVSDYLDSLSLPYFLIQGTALGAYRDSGFVPTEKDIDIAILQEDFLPRVGDIAKHFVDLGCEIESWGKPFGFIRTLVTWYHGIKIDFVGMLKWANYRFTACPVHHSIKVPYAIVHEASMLEVYQEVELFGRTFKIPSPIESYLELEYGPGWRVPQDDHISRTRRYNFLQDNNITYE